MKKDKCILRNKKSKLYFAGYASNSPQWDSRILWAKEYFAEDVEVARVQKRLSCQCQEVEVIPL